MLLLMIGPLNQIQIVLYLSIASFPSEGNSHLLALSSSVNRMRLGNSPFCDRGYDSYN